MKALCLRAPRQFEFTEIPEPSQPQSGEALVRVHRVGICGTDYGGFLGKMPFYSYPRIPGHELGVEVLEVGADVSNVAQGDHCAVEPYINCQTCYSCRRGLTNCCEHHKTLGVMCDGGMSRYFLLPARKLHKSEKLSMEQLALVETLAIGCHAIDRGNPQRQETVLVIGAGPIGLSVIEFAKVAQARVIVMDISPERLQFVQEKMGIPNTILATHDNLEWCKQQIDAMTNHQFADVVVDATGNNQSMARALEFCAFGGRLVYVGITQSEVSLPHAPILHRREVSILASRNALSRDFPRIIELIEQGIINTVPWITHYASFDDVPSAFPTWLQPESRVIKAIVEID